MVHKSNKIIVITMIIAILLSSLSLFSASAVSEGNFIYSVNNGKVRITDYTGNASSVNIPDTIKGLPVTEIGDNAFRDCTGLSNITIPDSVTKIGREAFWNTAFLNNKSNWNEGVLYLDDILLDVDYTKKGTLVIKDNTTIIADYALYMSGGITDVTIPASVKYVGESAFALCRKLDNISVSAKNTNLSSVDGVLFNKDKTTLICYPNGKGNLEYNIPKTVKTIGAGAFMFCDNLIDIDVPDTVTSIGKEAFAYCEALTEATIPSKITVIPAGMYDHCGSLSKIEFHDNIVSIEDNAFKWCSGLKAITLPAKLIEIDSNAFEQCRNLTEVTFPNTVELVGDGAFHNCVNLTKILFEGTKIQWNAVKVELNNNPLVDATKKFNGSSVVSVGHNSNSNDILCVSLFDSRLISYTQEPIGGAKYGLFTSKSTTENGLIPEKYMVATVTTTGKSSDKFITKDGHAFTPEKNTDYYIQEVEAPNGYYFDNKIITVKPEDFNKTIKLYNKSYSANLVIEHEYKSSNPDKLAVYQICDKTTGEILYFNTLSNGYVWMSDRMGANVFTAYPNEEIELKGLATGLYNVQKLNSETNKFETVGSFEVVATANDNEIVLFTVSENESQTILGDVTGDKEVNIKDATTIQKHLASIVTLDETALIASDFNEDGRTTISDVTAIQKMLAGIS